MSDCRSVLLALLLVASCGSAQAQAPKANPPCKQVHTPSQLQAIGNDLTRTYCLTEDIDLSAVGNFKPIGSDATPFTGRLLGRGHTITNLKINRHGVNVGLFAATDGATIRDLNFVNADIKAADANAKVGLIGHAYAAAMPSSLISGVHVSGQIACLNSSCFAGGIAGMIEAEVTLDLSSSSAKLIVKDNSSVGGLLGRAQPNAKVTRSYATGDINATDSASAGGLIGLNGGNVTASFATGSVISGDLSTTGGLIGNSGASTLKHTFALGAATAGINSDVGGLVGIMGATTLSDSYAAGPVSSGGSSGGLVGFGGTNTITNSYWDTDTTGLTFSPGGGTGQTTLQLRADLPSGFASPWSITKTLSYPFLKTAEIDFAAPLAALVRHKRIFVFLPISQNDKSNYNGATEHIDQASLATVYTMIARAIGISDQDARLKDVAIDRYYWHDASGMTTFNGPVTKHASLGSLQPIASTAKLDDSNVIGKLNSQRLVILRGRYSKDGGGSATHYVLATLFTQDNGGVRSVIANDPFTGRQVEISPTSKKVTSPSGFPLANFKVDGYQPVTID